MSTNSTGWPVPAPAWAVEADLTSSISPQGEPLACYYGVGNQDWRKPTAFLHRVDVLTEFGPMIGATEIFIVGGGEVFEFEARPDELRKLAADLIEAAAQLEREDAAR